MVSTLLVNRVAELGKRPRRRSHDNGAARGVSGAVAGTDVNRAGKPGHGAAFMRADRRQRDERVLPGAGDENVSGRGPHQRGAADRGQRRRGVDVDRNGVTGGAAVDGRQRRSVGIRGRRRAAATLQARWQRSPTKRPGRPARKSHVVSGKVRSHHRCDPKGPPVCPAGEKPRSHRPEQRTCHDDAMPCEDDGSSGAPFRLSWERDVASGAPDSREFLDACVVSRFENDQARPRIRRVRTCVGSRRRGASAHRTSSIPIRRDERSDRRVSRIGGCPARQARGRAQKQ